MTKRNCFAVLMCFGLLGPQYSALAAHTNWHREYDRDNDNRWNYDEFVAAQRAWQMRHGQNLMSDDELHQSWERLDKDRDGYLSPYEANRFHKW